MSRHQFGLQKTGLPGKVKSHSAKKERATDQSAADAAAQACACSVLNSTVACRKRPLSCTEWQDMSTRLSTN